MIDCFLSPELRPAERIPKPTINANVKVGDTVSEWTHSSGPTILAQGTVIYVGEHFYRVRFKFRGGSYVEAYPIHIATAVNEDLRKA